MKAKNLLTLAFFVTAAIPTARAAWQKVPMPRVEEPITKMAFANPALGYALVYDTYSGRNFFRYMNGRWADSRGCSWGAPAISRSSPPATVG